jgi:hypothetical protein
MCVLQTTEEIKVTWYGGCQVFTAQGNGEGVLMHGDRALVGVSATLCE